MLFLVILIYLVVITGDIYLIRKEVKLREIFVYVVMVGISFIITIMLSLGKEIPAYVNYMIDAVNYFVK